MPVEGACSGERCAAGGASQRGLRRPAAPFHRSTRRAPAPAPSPPGCRYPEATLEELAAAAAGEGEGPDPNTQAWLQRAFVPASAPGYAAGRGGSGACCPLPAAVM